MPGGSVLIGLFRDKEFFLARKFTLVGYSVKIELCICDPYDAASLDGALPKTPVCRFQIIHSWL